MMLRLAPKIWPVLLLLSVLSAAHAAPATDFSLPAREQSVIHLHDYAGRPVYVDFWASWCGPCRQSFPWMNRLQQRFGADGLVIIAINLDKDRRLAERFIADTSPQFNIAFDPAGSTAEAYAVEVMPSSYLIDRQGNVVARHLGFNSNNAAQIETEIETLLRSQ